MDPNDCILSLHVNDVAYGAKNCMGDEHHRQYKHTKFRQNLRGDLIILIDLTLIVLPVNNSWATFWDTRHTTVCLEMLVYVMLIPQAQVLCF